MMKKQYNFILLVGLLALLVSCADDFLDRPPLSNVMPDQYFENESQLEAYSIEQYDVLPTHDAWGFGTFGLDMHTDNMAAATYDNKYVPGQWRVDQNGGSWSFTNIYQYNYFLQEVLPKWKNGEISGSADNINHYIGEIYFLRANEYFNKVMDLGDFPIVKTVLPDNMDELTAASVRAPRSEVVRFIVSDLDSAITLMMETSPDGANNRLNQACAQLLKSRVTLYEASWLQNFSNTAFVPNGPNWPGAEEEYNKDYEYQAGSIDAEIEWLLEQSMEAAAAVADVYALTDNNGILQQSLTDANNDYFDMFSAVDMSGYSEVLLWRRYDKGLGVVHNVPTNAQRGNLSTGLTRGLVQSFVMSNGLPIYAAGSGYEGDDYISDVRASRDGRLWLFLKEPEQINILYEAAEGVMAVPIEPVPNITIPAESQRYNTGYTIRKGLNYDAAHCANGYGYTGSIVYRATEAYLNYIEACYLKNKSLDGKASSYWTAIRARAGVNTDFQETISKTQMNLEAEGDWGAYTAGNLVDPTLYNIRRERRCELMAEGLRWMDLKRWRSMDQMITTPYHIEGFKLWGPMQNWYDPADLTYGTAMATVSDPSVSDYLRPYERTGDELVYNGYLWAMAHYLNPIAAQHFLITSGDNDPSSSPIYQNPGWSTEANTGPTY